MGNFSAIEGHVSHLFYSLRLELGYTRGDIFRIIVETGDVKDSVGFIVAINPVVPTRRTILRSKIVRSRYFSISLDSRRKSSNPEI